MPLHITLRQLEIYCAVVTTGSAVAAGEQIGLSQSAVSSALKELEHQLGEQLFERIGKRLICNEQGKAIYPRALAILEGASELQQLFHDDVGTLHVAASTTIGNYLLPPILAEFQKKYPNIVIRLTVANSYDVIESVAQLKCDIGLIEGGCHHPDITTHIWQYDELVWFCAKGSQWLSVHQPIALAELLTKPLIIRETGSGTQELLEHTLAQYGLTLNANKNRQLTVMELGNSEAIKQAVRHDLGIGCLSRYTIAELLELQILQEILTIEPNILRPLLVIQHSQKSPSRLLNLFKKFI